MKKYENLLKPIKVGNMELKNRMTFAPTYSFLADIRQPHRQETN